MCVYACVFVDKDTQLCSNVYIFTFTFSAEFYRPGLIFFFIRIIWVVSVAVVILKIEKNILLNSQIKKKWLHATAVKRKTVFADAAKILPVFVNF